MWVRRQIRRSLGAVVACALCFAPFLVAWYWGAPRDEPAVSLSEDPREEVVFWHFWGGGDRVVVQSIIDAFNNRQQRYRVRGIAMPGNNLDMKVFMSVAGGDPPDLINQDDPILVDWKERGAVLPLDSVAAPEELEELDEFLLPTARRLSVIDGRYWALCNGLDIRALYINRTLLDQLRLEPPTTLADLDQIARRASQRDASGRLQRAGFIPDGRRYWAWAQVFGAEPYDAAAQRFDLTSPRSLDALAWMQSYRELFGAAEIASFRQADQSLPGKTFALLARRYVAIMDGQWRVRDIEAFTTARQQQGEPVDRFDVLPLPPPPGGVRGAGWLNGNYFLIPAGAKEADGAWQFMKFWIGVGGNEAFAARICAAGGWIPVSQQVIDSDDYQAYLQSQPLMETFVRLAGSENQQPVPLVRHGSLVKRKLESLGALLMTDPDAPEPKQLAEVIESEINDAI